MVYIQIAVTPLRREEVRIVRPAADITASAPPAGSMAIKVGLGSANASAGVNTIGIRSSSHFMAESHSERRAPKERQRAGQSARLPRVGLAASLRSMRPKRARLLRRRAPGRAELSVAPAHPRHRSRAEIQWHEPYNDLVG